MSNRIYEIVEEIATLSGTGRSKRKVRRIRWDNSPDSVLDIRKWFQEVDGTETPCKGIKLDAAEEAAPEAPAEEAAAAAQPAEEAASPAAPAEGGEKPVFDPEAPNQNPVEAGPAVAPKDESGKFDPTKIAEASDFGDWEEQGCKG